VHFLEASLGLVDDVPAPDLVSEQGKDPGLEPQGVEGFHRSGLRRALYLLGDAEGLLQPAGTNLRDQDEPEGRSPYSLGVGG